jgi:hypothetical protein
VASLLLTSQAKLVAMAMDASTNRPQLAMVTCRLTLA